MVEEIRNPQQVAVTDVHMPFASMVVFMVKWAIAAIPALLILAIVAAVIYAVIPAVIVGLIHPFHSVPVTAQISMDKNAADISRPSDEAAVYQQASIAVNEANERCRENATSAAGQHCAQLVKDCFGANPDAAGNPKAARTLATCLNKVRP